LTLSNKEKVDVYNLYNLSLGRAQEAERVPALGDRQAVDMSGAEHLLRLGGIVLVYALAGAVCLKVFARALSFAQAFTICLAAFAVSIGLFTAYIEFDFRTVVPSWVDSVIWTGVLGLLPLALIEWLARQRGIEKTGWCGVGTKTYVSLAAINWLAIGIFVTIRHLQILS
jgi:hypothetical protein